MRKRFASLLFLYFVAAGVHAQSYPAKPVRLVAAYPPGGSIDVVARLVAQQLTEAFGRQVIVENRSGASGNIGTEYVARAAPDGYTLLLGSAPPLAANMYLFTKLAFDPVRDFAPIIRIANQPNVLVVHPTVPAATVQELIALAKAKPGQLNFASSGSGTTNHLAAELFCIMAGIKMQHIPHKGAGPATADLMGGQVQMFMNNALPLIPIVKGGRARGIAISGGKRLVALPDVPTFTEAGLPGYEVKSWQGILAPAGTPKALIDKLSQEITRILNTPEMSEQLITMGADPLPGGPQQFAALIKTDMARYAKLIRQANIKLE